MFYDYDYATSWNHRSDFFGQSVDVQGQAEEETEKGKEKPRASKLPSTRKNICPTSSR
jgi:hypothetical protein